MNDGTTDLPLDERLKRSAALATASAEPALTDQQLAEAALSAAVDVNKALATFDRRVGELEARGIHASVGFFDWRVGPSIEVGQPMQIRVALTRRVFLGGLG